MNVIRHHRAGVNIWYLCGSCLLLCLLTNIAILRCDFSSYDNDDGYESRILVVDHHRKSDVNDYPKGLSFENKFRKLMQNSVDVSEGDDGGAYSDVNDVTTMSHGSPNTMRPDMISCRDLPYIRNVSHIASGWTKAVYKGVYQGNPVAVKTVDVSGEDVTRCSENGGTLMYCYQKAARKILKEIVLLQDLEHDNVVKVLGYCIPDSRYTGEAQLSVAMVTELGETIDIIKLLQMWWEERLRIAYDMTKLIQFLAHTSYGSLSMNDFRRQQFVLVGGTLKLTDVDDVGVGEQSCDADEDCTIYFSSENITIRIPCLNGHCDGYNEKKNIYNAGRHFTTFLLPFGAPASLRSQIDKIVDGFGNVTMTTDKLLDEMEKIVSLYKTGSYLKRTGPEDAVTHYTPYQNSDLPVQYDYKCRYSLSASGCTISVFDQREAEELCEADLDCQGFVISPERTWAGRYVAHLKSGFGKPIRKKGTNLYVRPTER